MADRSTIGDYVTLQRGTTYKGNLVGKPGPALLGLGSIQPGGGFRDADYKTYGGECPSKLMLFPGDLFVSLKGATKDGKMIGSVARVPPTVTSGRLTQDTVKLELRDSDRETANFLYWILRTPKCRDYCAGRATGSAVVALSREDFLAYPVPAITTMTRRLVMVLEALEGKIELNRRMNATLEAIAQALFKSWFVDFDPVRAKASGESEESICQRLGLSREVLALFPDRLVESELGEIPTGWEVLPVGEVVECVGGGTPSTSEADYWEGGTHHWTTPKDLSSLQAPFLIDTDRKLTDEGIKKVSSGLLPSGTLLLSSRAPVGYLAITDIPMAINQGYIAMKCCKRASNYFMQNFRPIRVILPSQNLMSVFTNRVAPMYFQVIKNLHQSQTLATIRDTLLPKLLSGELSVVEADRALGVPE